MPEHVAPAFIRIRTGLLEPKHIARMGHAITLYLYLHSKVWFKGDEAGVTREPYTHEQAASDLGVKVRTVRDWFTTLRAEHYITAQRLQYGLKVTITNYASDGPGGGVRVTLERQSDERQSDTGTSVSAIQTDTGVAAECRSSGGRLTPERQSESSLPIVIDSQENQEKQEDDESRARATAAATLTLDALDRFNATLVGAPGYQSVPDFLLKVRQKYGHLDLEEEAIKARDWARRHRRPCSHGYLLNWLKKAAAEKEALAAAAKPATTPRPSRIEPPPLPGPVIPASPEVRAEYDAIRNGRRPKPPRGGDPATAAEFERKRAAALAAAQARIGALP